MMMFPRSIFVWSFLIIASVAQVISADEFPPVALTLGYDTIELQNGFIKVSLSRIAHSITAMYADFHGSGHFESALNVLSKPFALEVETSKCAFGIIGEASLYVVENNAESATFTISSSVGCTETAYEKSGESFVTETWTVGMKRGDRRISLEVVGSVTKSLEEVSYISHGVYTQSASLYGLFDRGVAQMMNFEDACLVAEAAEGDALPRMYTLGNGTALDVLYSYSGDTAAKYSVLMTAHDGVASGVQSVVVGNVSHTTTEMETAWGSCKKLYASQGPSEGSATTFLPTTADAGTSWSVSMEWVPNNFDFPALPVVEVAKQPRMKSFDDLRCYLMGIYASPAGCLKSFYAGWEGTIAPTIAHPDTGYSPDTNFFDPDNYISISALLYSGDQYFIDQTREVLERTAATMCGIGEEQVDIYCKADPTRVGQLMHHFVNLVPDYESIATSTQLGPNIFWTLTALQYASVTGDRDWLVNKMLPYIDLSTDYILQLLDPSYGLLKVAGPLWIDVLVRENYTSDSNAAAVYLMDKLAGMYDYVHDNDETNERSMQLRAVREGIVEGMSKYLWNTSADDHFITQLNPDGTTRDFVDYDANLLAVAFGAVPAGDPRIDRILTRVDSGNYTHVRGTWCCEVPYSGDAEDCYIVGGDVCGDSVVTLGRIGWADSHARKRVGDVSTFVDKLLEPLQQDLMDDVWLFERYDANGTQIRTSFYFEYPSFVVMMLREIVYGIELDVNTVNIDPFPNIAPGESFFYNLGNTEVYFSAEKVVLVVPGDNDPSLFKNFNINDLKPDSKYSISQTCEAARKKNEESFEVWNANKRPVARGTANERTQVTVMSDANGLLSFSMSGVSDKCRITVEKLD